jgi:hypothetical protein
MAAAMRRARISLCTIAEGTGFLAALSLVLTGCGGSGSDARAVEKALARQFLAQGAHCTLADHITHSGQRLPLYRCTFVEESSVRAMKSQAGYFLYYANGTVESIIYRQH